MCGVYRCISRAGAIRRPSFKLDICSNRRKAFHQSRRRSPKLKMHLSFATSITLVSLAAANPLSNRLAKRAAIDDCLRTANVPVDAPNSNDWRADSNPFNQRLKYTPVAIAVPTTVAQVQAAVSCAAKVNVKVNPKSGGHSYASFGLGGEDGHFVVQLDRMNAVTYDSATEIATVQAGARLGRVATALYNNGKRAFSHGTCPGYVVNTSAFWHGWSQSLSFLFDY